MNTSEEIKPALNNLLDVGPEKPVGYLPIETIVGLCKTTVEVLVKELEAQGLFTQTFGDGECQVHSGALYAADLKALQELLDNSAETLQEAAWPNDAKKFIEKIATVNAPVGTKLFDLVADTFNDSDNVNRTDV